MAKSPLERARDILRGLDAWRQTFRLSYLPPLMIYVAYGISGLTGIVGTFYVKERLNLSAEFLAVIGFWVGIPWVCKMPFGHFVDLIWRWKGLLVVLGAGLLASSLGIMVGLLGQPEVMTRYASIEAWFILAALLGPTGYVIQDIVADAMTVEAVPKVDERGDPVSKADQDSQHITMQALGRVAMIGGGLLVALLNVVLMRGVGELPAAEKAAAYLFVYQLALVIPLVSVSGVALAWWLRRRHIKGLLASGRTAQEAHALLDVQHERPAINWWILIGGCAFAVLAIAVGLSEMTGGQEIIFLCSMAIVILMMKNLVKEISSEARYTIVAIAVVIFVFRAMPGVGSGATWWVIDVLKFDQAFLAWLGLIGSTLALVGIFLLRNFMATKSIPYVLGTLTIVGTILSLPTLGMYYGLHEWTAAHTGGVVDARFIAIIDTALESPLGQVSMIPMLAWIARSAPTHLKATFFAVFASFTNLALSASQLGTKYLNQIFVVTREVRDEATKAVITPADYSELGMIIIIATVIGLVLPMLAILIFRHRASGMAVAVERS